jgi:hypothetical protein
VGKCDAHTLMAVLKQANFQTGQLQSRRMFSCAKRQGHKPDLKSLQTDPGWLGTLTDSRSQENNRTIPSLPGPQGNGAEGVGEGLVNTQEPQICALGAARCV